MRMWCIQASNGPRPSVPLDSTAVRSEGTDKSHILPAFTAGGRKQLKRIVRQSERHSSPVTELEPVLWVLMYSMRRDWPKELWEQSGQVILAVDAVGSRHLNEDVLVKAWIVRFPFEAASALLPKHNAYTNPAKTILLRRNDHTFIQQAASSIPIDRHTKPRSPESQNTKIWEHFRQPEMCETASENRTKRLVRRFPQLGGVIRNSTEAGHCHLLGAAFQGGCSHLHVIQAFSSPMDGDLSRNSHPIGKPPASSAV